MLEGGVNVAVVSGHAERIFFCLFENGKEVRFTLASRQGDVRYGFIPGVRADQHYGFRAEGPYDVAAGQLFDIFKLLIDPFAVMIDHAFVWHPDLATKGAETSYLVPKCIVAAAPPQVQRLPYRAPGFIYELAVKAFTKLQPQIPEDIR
ncbi:MAG: glycogen debranching enzyme GlgX, partial [Aestuariivirga sp.]